jgi:hypothetical protein
LPKKKAAGLSGGLKFYDEKAGRLWRILRGVKLKVCRSAE